MFLLDPVWKDFLYPKYPNQWTRTSLPWIPAWEPGMTLSGSKDSPKVIKIDGWEIRRTPVHQFCMDKFTSCISEPRHHHLKNWPLYATKKRNEKETWHLDMLDFSQPTGKLIYQRLSFNSFSPNLCDLCIQKLFVFENTNYFYLFPHSMLTFTTPANLKHFVFMTTLTKSLSFRCNQRTSRDLAKVTKPHPKR